MKKKQEIYIKNMKKNDYIAPESRIRFINIKEALLTGSIQYDGNNPIETGDPTDEGSDAKYNDFGSVWED